MIQPLQYMSTILLRGDGDYDVPPSYSDPATPLIVQCHSKISVYVRHQLYVSVSSADHHPLLPDPPRAGRQ